VSTRVFLIDGHDDARDALAERLLRSQGLELVGAADSVERAAELLGAAQPDVVLLDVPAHDGGVETCRAVRKLTDRPIIISTTFLTPELWAAARAAGATDYILKQIDSGRLGREIERIASGGDARAT